jgi:hypothetical protein
LLVTIVSITAGSAQAQNPEDELGNWFIYNGTLRFTHQWNVFTEAQLRLWEVASNVDEVFARAALQYEFPNFLAMVGIGYLRSENWAYDDSEHEQSENRIYEQFGLRQQWSRSIFEHRYRLEQRWLSVHGALAPADRSLVAGALVSGFLAAAVLLHPQFRFSGITRDAG